VLRYDSKLNISTDDLLKVFNDIDMDRDQYITHNEYEIWIGKLNSMLLDQIIKQQKPQQPPAPKVIYYNNVNDSNIDTNSLLGFLKTMDTKSLDMNNDGIIRYNEMVEYFKRYYSKPMSQENIKKIFYDINNNMNYGQVNLDKLNAWIGRLNSLHLEKILKGSATANNNINNYNQASPKVKYYGPNDPNKGNYNNIDYGNNGNNQMSQGYHKPFSMSQSDIKDLLLTLQNMNIRSLDYGNTNTVMMDVFDNYFQRLNREIPNAIVNKIWNAIDYQKSGSIFIGEYQRFLSGLNEDKLKYICSN